MPRLEESMTHDQARKLGAAAAREGLTALACPYPTGLWRREWLAAFNEERAKRYNPRTGAAQRGMCR